MTESQAKLAGYLFKKLGRRVPLGDLNREESLWGRNVSDETIKKHGRDLSTWFAIQDPPVALAIETSGGDIWMMKL